jgi:hypothetical protein
MGGGACAIGEVSAVCMENRGRWRRHDFLIEEMNARARKDEVDESTDVIQRTSCKAKGVNDKLTLNTD